jgi:hypothetical protein
VFSLWGYSRSRSKRLADVAVFVAILGGLAAFFALLFWLFATRYLDLFKRLVGG